MKSKMAQGVVYNMRMSTVAQNASEHLRRQYQTAAACQDLGNGPVELLREVLSQITVEEQYSEQARILENTKSTLLWMRMKLLDWENSNFPDALFECPLPLLPRTWPNACWSHKHPCPAKLHEEVQACLRFMDEHGDCFLFEPWKWVRSLLETLDLNL